MCGMQVLRYGFLFTFFNSPRVAANIRDAQVVYRCPDAVITVWRFYFVLERMFGLIAALRHRMNAEQHGIHRRLSQMRTCDFAVGRDNIIARRNKHTKSAMYRATKKIKNRIEQAESKPVEGRKRI